MAVPDWILFVFIFANGCCIGSFLNVVVYRMPRDKSLMWPPSACPACNRHIRFYDNIPLISWLILGRKCRFCKAPVSPRYFLIELLTAAVFLGLFILYFSVDQRKGMPALLSGGWLIYLLHIILVSALIAASAIDLELWIIPLGICWLVTAAGFITSALGVYLIDPSAILDYSLLPVASSATGALAAGAAVGLGISSLLLTAGLLKRSYESDVSGHTDELVHEDSRPKNDPPGQQDQLQDENFNHRLEAVREIVFLLPIVICATTTFWMSRQIEPIANWWRTLSQIPAIAGLLGSIWGYFVGCGIVWAIRIFGTLAFGKEAMGLGDVHLMGAAGSVVGPLLVVVAFFIAPFFGLLWAGFQMFFKKVRQIPYGPFLSLGVFIVMIFHDWIFDRIGSIVYRQY